MIAEKQTLVTQHKEAIHNLLLITKILSVEHHISEGVKDEILKNLGHISSNPLDLLIEYIGQKIECHYQGKQYQLEVVQTII